ncbi:MAG: hypothetical protein NC924_02730, partial [Candidatus Omnitrophica bacterium]|nr:hypothetical protein [Candidatus Omnitrophota bacterium]
MQVTWLFDIAYLFLAIIYVPGLALRGRHRRGFLQRCGIFPAAVREKLRTRRPLIWMHAVSVGEIKAAAPLVEGLRQEFPEHALIISP